MTILGSPTATLEVTLKPVSPDLEVRITSQALDQAAAQRIADSEWPPNALLVKAGRHSSLLPKWLTSKKGQGELFIGAHDILDDEADWNSETWLFAPTAIPRFIGTLKRLYELLPQQFELVAAWVTNRYANNMSREQNCAQWWAVVSVTRTGWRPASWWSC